MPDKPCMLRRMSSPRVVSRPIALSCVLLAAAAPLACQQVQEMINGKPEEKKPDPVVAVDTKTVTPPVVAPTAMPKPVPETHAVTLDEMLALVHADSTGEFVIVRNPSNLLDLGDEAFKFYDGPVQTLVGLIGAPDVASGFAAAKAGLLEARKQLETAGIDLSRGLVMTQTASGGASAVLLVSAAKADGVKGLLTGLKLPDADKMVCQAIDAAPGYVGCADSEAVLKAYKPGDGKKRRDTAAAGLPGVNLDELSLLAFSPDNGGLHVGAATPAGAGVLHIGLPADGNDIKQAMASLEPGPSTTLRFAQPGAGFLWARTDVNEMKKQSPQLGAVPPPFDGVMGAWNGEVFFGGSSDPAALELRLGLSDTKPIEAAITAGAAALKTQIPTTIPGIDTSKLSFDVVDLKIGGETVKAAHLAVTGIDAAPTLKHLVGLGLDGWVFAAEGSLAMVVGPDADNVGKMIAASSVDATLASLPHALADDLKANRVNFMMHIPVDALQGPSLRKGLDAVLKNVAQYQPDQARSALSLLAPLSSGTAWITEVGGVGVVHMAVQGIGHTADDEGRAALAAAVAVAGGGDPSALFGELVSKYPGSPRLAAYQARAGLNGPGVLVGSAVGGLALTGAIAYTIVNGAVNPNLATELGVPPPDAAKPVEAKPEEKKPEEVKPEEKKPEETKPVETTPEDKAAADKAAADKAAADKAAADKKAADKKAADKKAADKAAADKKAADKAAADKAAADKQAEEDRKKAEEKPTEKPTRKGRDPIALPPAK